MATYNQTALFQCREVSILMFNFIKTDRLKLIKTILINFVLRNFFLKKWAIHGLFFFIFVFSIHSWQ